MHDNKIIIGAVIRPTFPLHVWWRPMMVLDAFKTKKIFEDPPHIWILALWFYWGTENNLYQ